MLGIVCHNSFLSFSKDDFCCSFPTWCCRQWHSMFKIKWEKKDFGRWCCRAGDSREDQTAIENAWNWERQRRRGSLHTNAVLWILVSLFTTFHGGLQLKNSLSLYNDVSDTVLFVTQNFPTTVLMNHRAEVASILCRQSWCQSDSCLHTIEVICLWYIWGNNWHCISTELTDLEMMVETR